MVRQWSRGFPGWTESGRKLNEEIAASSAASIAEAEQELDEALKAPVNASVLEHWMSLGGRNPDQ